ncbi:hypothetical protein D3C80_1578780 [compost metagenome]
MKPCITTSPAMVPTEELDKPAISRPRPKAIAVTGPARLLNCAKATSRSSTTSPFLKNKAAATITMAIFTAPAITIAMTISIISHLKICFFCFSSTPTTRLWVSDECR